MKVLKLLPYQKMALTLVTGFFDLGRREGGNRRRAEDYMIHGDKVLDLDVNLVIFVDSDYGDHIWNYRRSKRLAGKTLVVPFPIERSRYYVLREKVKAGLQKAKSDWNPNKFTDLYAIVTWAKMEFIEKVMAMNPFNSTHFGWIDFGLSHVVPVDQTQIRCDRILTEPFDKIRMLCIHYPTKEQVSNREQWSSKWLAIIGGGFFTGSHLNMVEFCQRIHDTIMDHLQTGHTMFEEEVMAVVYHQNPTLFELYFGHYGGLLCNYRYLRVEAYRVVSNMQLCMAHKAYDICVRIGDYSWRDYHDGKFKASLAEFLRLCDNYVVALFYRNQTVGRCDGDPPVADHSRMNEVIEFYKRALVQNPDVIPQVVDDRVRGNFNFFGHTLPELPAPDSSEHEKVSPIPPKAQSKVEIVPDP